MPIATESLLIDVCADEAAAFAKEQQRRNSQPPRLTTVYAAATAQIAEFASATAPPRGPCGERPKRYLAPRWIVLSWIAAP